MCSKQSAYISNHEDVRVGKVPFDSYRCPERSRCSLLTHAGVIVVTVVGVVGGVVGGVDPFRMNLLSTYAS